MRLFTSTRGGDPVPLVTALFRGLAPDGGLYVPTVLPDLANPPETGTGDFRSVARWAGARLFPELSADTLDRLVTDALSFPVPLVEIEPGLHVLELFHGPSHAFKDIGARFMAQLMAVVDPRPGAHGPARTVLVATSGDTGGAVASAFHGLEGYRVVALFPHGAISERQRRQMTTLGGNVAAVAVHGTFDDCQRLTKEAYLDAELVESSRLTSANSINVGRLLPQSLYYLLASATVGGGPSPPRFVVPSGNLGNLCAGLLASRSGMPAAGFLAATNVNDVFGSFLATGAYEPRPSAPTMSSAMDVGAPSNLERIRWLYRDDPEALRAYVQAVRVDDPETEACITDVYTRTGYVLDPHTAVAYRAYRKHDGPHEGPAVVLATAHPAKFPEVVERAIGRSVDLPEGLAHVMDAQETMHETRPELDALRRLLSTDLFDD